MKFQEGEKDLSRSRGGRRVEASAFSEVVKEGQVVSAGQKIAEMGNTDSNTVKLHFEIRRLGKSVDPAKYLNQN